MSELSVSVSVSERSVSSGPEAEELLKDMGKEPCQSSLTDLCRHNHHFRTSSGYFSMLSMQSHAVSSSLVTTLLVQHTEPAAYLTAQVVSNLLTLVYSIIHSPILAIQSSRLLHESSKRVLIAEWLS